MNLSISILLPGDRADLGKLYAWSMDLRTIGPFPCDGKSDNTAAIAAGNPTRNPELPFGDTPLGDYTGSISYIPDTPADRFSYGDPDESGAIPTIELCPVEGDTQAWQAKLNSRTGLRIHCGALNGAGAMRPTHGCVRMEESDFRQLLAAVKTLGSPASLQGATFSVNIAPVTA